MSRSLRNLYLYLYRAGFSAAWVALVSSVSAQESGRSNVNALVGLLLVAYPIADLAATIVDLRAGSAAQPTLAQRVNVAVAATAAAAIGIAASVSITSAMDAFAGWAIASGIIQLTVGARRLGLLRGQWLMIISGAGSIFAGTTFIGWNDSSSQALLALARYSIGGGVWYLLTALWLTRPLTGAASAVLKDR